ncbi:toprim domain-containing protein [Stappia indica]|uniref:toprim domain-containing protein n=1 Tax=Stappia indica TaxID=538381 RepID=UPI001CD7CB6D|nr:toprim domain-containing protein [Stappia indica]MCA1298021.1 toprim domain-containing protein [Stappia indica]
MFHQKTKDAAKGQWRGILMHLGVPGEALRDRHGPCPICGGKNRFRYDNRDGNGTFICNQCGAGDGLSLAMKFTGRPFIEVAPQIDRILGNERFERDAPKAEYRPDQIRAWLREVAAQTVRVEPGDVVDRYLQARGIGEEHYPKALRTAKGLRDGKGGVRPAMVATVQGPDGANVTLHRTYLRPDGLAKAEMDSPRKMMPGDIPDGSAVRLCDDFAGGALGIGEGIETCMSAAVLFEIPVWAALNTGLLKKWQPPEGCDEVVIFADNDANFAGHRAAYELANRLSAKGLSVTVKVPPLAGQDWNDVLMAKRGARQQERAMA